LPRQKEIPIMITKTQASLTVRHLTIVLAVVLFVGAPMAYAGDGTHSTGDGFVPPPPGSGGGKMVQTLPIDSATGDPETALDSWDSLELLVRVGLFLRFV
jgi:hypothetical protein